jgi:hypothetical protein
MLGFLAIEAVIFDLVNEASSDAESYLNPFELESASERHAIRVVWFCVLHQSSFRWSFSSVLFGGSGWHVTGIDDTAVGWKGHAMSVHR